MSQSPPFPPTPERGEPMPVPPPLYAIPYAAQLASMPPMAPIPVQSLTHITPVARRPGLITAIGVISIIVGGLTVLSTAVQGLQMLLMVAIAQTTTAMARATAAAQVAASRPPAAGAIAQAAEGGIANVAERKIVLIGLSRARPLPLDRRRQLDALLQAGGHEMFLFRGPQLTEQAIQSNVSDSGRKFADDGNGADFYLVGQGEIEVYDTHAVFYPGDGGEMISASAPSDDPAVETPAGAAAGQTTGGYPASGSSSASVTMNAPIGGPTTMPALPVMGAPRFDRRALAVLMIERLLSLILAVYLFVIGIMVLRQSPRGRRLHRLYAVAKIPLALIGGWATWKLWTSFLLSTGAPISVAAWTPWIIALTVLACIYPIALLIVLRSRSVREYYDSVTPPTM